jgi:hypothetical protein
MEKRPGGQGHRTLDLSRDRRPEAAVRAPSYGADEAGAEEAVAAMADDDAIAEEAGADESAGAADSAAADESAAGAAFFLQAARPRAATPASASARVTDFFMEVLL